MDLREDHRKPKRSARSRARTRLIEEDAETEYSYGSLENSGTESSLHGDESSNLGDARELSTEPSTLTRSKADEKKCVFCWRGKKSSLGQGQLTRCDPTAGFNPFRKSLKGRQNSSEQETSKRRNKGDQSKSPRRPTETGKYANVYNELTDVGLPLDIAIADIYDESDRAVYAHHCCAAWSEGVLQAEDYSLQSVDKAAFAGLLSKCSFCERLGATIPCKAPKCNKKFHYPCASGSGCFQDIRTLTLLCPDHAEMAEVIAKDESHCVVCSQPGNILNQLFCTSCGQHYHGDCLEFEIECNTVVRAGWQCPDCKLCQECRNPGDDNKMLVCDVCDKGFHTFCLVPVMTKVPPNGWRCHNCRSCVECGQKSLDNRWHKNYTVCDICHLQKQRGSSCPFCKKAYKFSNTRGMTMCTGCKKHVHNTCDKEAEKTDPKKYKCCMCTSAPPASTVVTRKLDTASADATLDDTMEVSEPTNFDSDSEMADSEKMSTSSTSSRIRPVKPGMGKPASFTRGKPSMKRPPPKVSRSAASSGAKSKGKVMKKRTRPAASDSRVKRSKIKETIATTHSTAPSAESVKKLDDEDQHAAVVLSAASDLFVLTQDMCMSCGSYGSGAEGDLITCTQCGQCYHPFCAQVKVNSVILTKGWRCLDCTVCEGCGKPTDEPNLLLCDECDISFHTYCLDPPLKQVPKGNWKCKWCVHCRYCGSPTPGFGCEWINNYTECGPCHSVTDCPVCEHCYMDSELVIQCNQCERWLHAACDNMSTEEDAERMSNLGYHCVFCRPKTGAQSPRPPTPIVQPPTPTSITSPMHPVVPVKEEERSYLVDGISLSENGLGLMKQLTIEMPPSQISIAQKAAQAARLARNRQMKIKQSHPQMTQLLSVSSDRSETAMEEDGGSMNTDEVTRSSLDVENEPIPPESLLSPAVSENAKIEFSVDGIPVNPADGIPLTDAASLDASKIKKRARKPPPLGIGGFVAKPRQKPPPKTAVVQGPYTEDGQPPILPTDVSSSGDGVVADAKKKIIRKIRKRGIIEDTYPSYLQEAFFGKDTLDLSKSETSTAVLSQDQPKSAAHELSISDPQAIPESCTITLSEGVTIPSSNPPFGMLSDTEDASNREGNAGEEVHPIDGNELLVPAMSSIEGTIARHIEDGEDLDILPGVSGDILPGGLHEEELYKIFEDIQSEVADTREAGPSDSKSSLRGNVEHDIDIDEENLEDFLKGIMENDGSAEAAASVLSELPVDSADAVPDAMSINPTMNASPLPMQTLSQPLHNQQQLQPPAQQALHPPQQQQQLQHQQPFQSPMPLHMPHQQSQHQPHQLQQMHPQLQQQLQQPQQQLQQQLQQPQQQLHQQMQQQLHQHPPMQSPLPAAMQDPFSMSMPSQFSAGPPSVQPSIQTNIQTAPDFSQQQHSQMMSQSAPASSLASSLPGSVSGSLPGTPFSPSTFNEPNWPTPSASTGADAEDGESMSLNQKNMLKWKDDEALGLESTISPVLFANTMHPELKQQYPEWTERCKHIGKYWRKMNTEQRNPYLVKARENRHKRSKLMKSARKKQMKESPMGSPRGAGASPGSASGMKAGETLGDVPSSPFPPPQTPQGGVPSGIDPYSATAATPAGIVQPSGAPMETDASGMPQAAPPTELYREDPYSQPPRTPFGPGSSGPPPQLKQPPTPMDTSGDTLTEDKSLGSSFPGPFTKRLTMLSRRVQSQDKQSHLNVVNKQQLLAGLGMNTEEVRQQRLRELLSTKPSGAEAMGWHPGSNPSPRAEFAGPRGPPTGYPMPRGWPPVDVGMAPILPPGHQMMRPHPRNRFMTPQSMYRQRNPGSVYPGRFQGPSHMMADGSRMPARMAQHHGLSPYGDSYQTRLSHPGRHMDPLGAPGHMGHTEQMAARAGGAHATQEEGLEDLLNTDGLSLLPFSDPVLDETLAEEHDKNMFDEHLGLKKEVEADKSAETAVATKQPLKPSKSDTADKDVNVSTSDKVVVESVPVSTVSSTAESTTCTSISSVTSTVTSMTTDTIDVKPNIKELATAVSTTGAATPVTNSSEGQLKQESGVTSVSQVGSVGPVKEGSTTTTATSSTAANLVKTTLSSCTNGDVTSARTAVITNITTSPSKNASTSVLTTTASSASAITSAAAAVTSAVAITNASSTTKAILSGEFTNSGISSTSKSTNATSVSPSVSRTSSTVGSPRVSMGVDSSPLHNIGSPRPIVTGSPRTMPTPNNSGSPHPTSIGPISLGSSQHRSNSSKVPGSPHPHAGGQMVPGSPHAHAGGQMVPGSPHPHAGGQMVPGSPHPHAGGQMVPGSPHPHAGGQMVPGSPHPHAGGQMVPGSPHPHVGGQMVPGSPHPHAGGQMVPGSPHPHVGGPMVPGSPHPHVGGPMVPGSPHPHVGGPMVPGSPHPGVIVSKSPHTVMGGHQAMHGGSPHSNILASSPHQQMTAQSPVPTVGMEPRPYSRQGSVDQSAMFQRSPSMGRMMGGPQYPGGTSLQHAPSPAKPSTAYHHPIPTAFTTQHHQMHSQPRPHFGDMTPASPFERMVDPRGNNPLQDLLDEEKRLQQSKQDGDVGRSATSLLSDQDFEKLKADVVNDPCGAAGLPQTSPRARFDAHPPGSEIWQPQPNAGGEFQPPPPPPYPGTGRMTPGMHMRGPYPTDHRGAVMPPMPPQSPGPRMQMMHGPGMHEMKEEEMQYRNWLHSKDISIQERLAQAEKDLNSAKKKKKALLNKQKSLKKSNEDLSVMDAQHLEKITTYDLPLLTKNIETIKADHKTHQRLVQEFNMKNQERMMHWAGGPMMPRHHSYPGMMHPRMRGMYPQHRPMDPRHMDPRQIEFERFQQQQRIQMMHGGGAPRPGMHNMQRQPYPEHLGEVRCADHVSGGQSQAFGQSCPVQSSSNQPQAGSGVQDTFLVALLRKKLIGSMDAKAAAFGGPRFGGMGPRMPMKADGTEPTEEEKRRYMMQQREMMQRAPGMRPTGMQDMAPRMQQPNMQPRFPGDMSKLRANTPPVGVQRQKSLPASKSKVPAKKPAKEGPSTGEATKKKRQRRRRASLTLLDEIVPEEGPSLHMTAVPTSFAGQHLVATPKPIVSAVPFVSASLTGSTNLEDIPSESMTSLGGQYPYKLVKSEPKVSASTSSTDTTSQSAPHNSTSTAAPTKLANTSSTSGSMTTVSSSAPKSTTTVTPPSTTTALTVASSAAISTATSTSATITTTATLGTVVSTPSTTTTTTTPAIPTTASSEASSVAASADSSTLDERILATIDSVAKGAGEMIWRVDRDAARREAERLAAAAAVAASTPSPSVANQTGTDSTSLHDTTPAISNIGSGSQEGGSMRQTGVPASVVTTSEGRATPMVTTSALGNHPTPFKPSEPVLGPGTGNDQLNPGSDSNALLKRLLENPKAPMSMQSGADISKSKLANITPEQQRKLEASAIASSSSSPYAGHPPPSTFTIPEPVYNNSTTSYVSSPAPGYSTAPTYDPFPWNPQLGFTPKSWASLSKKGRQQIYESRMTPEGQVIRDHGTIISVPNSSRPVYQMNPMHMNPTGNVMKQGPLHAMQNMRSALTAETGMAQPAAAAATAPTKKKKAPQGDKKKKGKPNTPTGSTPTGPMLGCGIPGSTATPSAGSLAEPTRIYEEAKQKLKSQAHINLQEPVLSATSYTSPIQPIKPLRVPNQRVVVKPKAPDLVGTYGRGIIEGKYDIYSYSPYTNLMVPNLKPTPTSTAEAPSKKGAPPKAAKVSDANQQSDVCDISMFQKVIDNTPKIRLSLPSPPLLRAPDSPAVPATPDSVINPSSPESVIPDHVTSGKQRRDAEYPFLGSIKDSPSEMFSSHQDGRLSPEIPLHTPVSIKVLEYAQEVLAKIKAEPVGGHSNIRQISLSKYDRQDMFGAMSEQEIKSTAVVLQSSLQSALRESPNNLVSVTLTVDGKQVEDIPNVLSELAELLRMKAPVEYQLEQLSAADKVVPSYSEKVNICQQCSALLPLNHTVVRREDQGDVLHFCNTDCSSMFSGSTTAKIESIADGEQKPEVKSIGRPNPKKSKRRTSETSTKPCKKWRGIKWRRWDIKVTFGLHKYEPPTEEDIKRTWVTVAQVVKPTPLPSDVRTCILCHQVGDGDTHVASRLLNHDVDKWVHLNCALWSTEVYETLNGALINIDLCIKRGSQIACVICGSKGATLGCFRPRCPNTYHVSCAYKQGAMFFQDKTILCPVHMPKESPDQLKQLTVARKVYVNRDESLQIANAVRSDDHPCSVRIGAVVYYSIGQLFTHQILTGRFHTRDYIYPVGYRCVRFFWSIRFPNKRCCYECSIAEGDEGAPVFVITIKEKGYTNKVYQASTPKEAWSNILDVVEGQRRTGDYVKIFPEYLSGEYMFGLKEPAIIRIVESLPGTELLAGYAFKFGKTQLIEMPPAINPTGCARSEPKLRTHFRKPHTLQASSPRTHLVPSMTTVAVPGDVNSPYHKQFVHSKSHQYRRLKNEWRNYVYLGRSRIQGLGMFAARDIEKHTMVIEYIGEVIRNELAEYREKIYDEHNRGVYMFRITEDFVIDATMSGGPARYINHSCDPNCVTETVQMDKDVKIVIIALRRINKGEELNYDYKFDLEDDSSKIPCNCGASNCRKWMN